MSNRLLKIVLMDSNPATLRCVFISDSCDLRDVNKIMCVIFGWKYKQSFSVWDQNDKEMRQIVKISEIKDLFFHYKSGVCNAYRFRISVLSDEDAQAAYSQYDKFKNVKLDYPYMCVSLGYNLPETVTSMTQYNAIQQEWLKPYSYYYSEFSSFKKEKYTPNFEDVNTKLELLYNSDSKLKDESKSANSDMLLSIDSSEAVQTSHVLFTMTIGEMKAAWEGRGLELYGRKKDMIEYIADFMCYSTTLVPYLNKMSMGEFNNFLDFMKGKTNWRCAEEMGSFLDELLEDRYAMQSYGYNGVTIRPTTSLVTAFKNWLKTVDFETYQKEANLRGIIKGAVCLYGIVNKETYQNLAKSYYKKKYTDAEMRACWDQYIKYGLYSKFMTVTRDGQILDRRNIVYQDPQVFINKMKKCNLKRYTPDAGQMQKISTGWGEYIMNNNFSQLVKYVSSVAYRDVGANYKYSNGLIFLMRDDADSEALLRYYIKIIGINLYGNAANDVKKQLIVLSKSVRKATLKGNFA